MPTSVGPNIAGDSNLVFGYDLGDLSNSYLGEPTTNNFGNNFRNFTGTTYSLDGEWTSNPTQLIKTYFPNLPTPIGPGATLIEESGSNGYHHLSRYGGGSESGQHTLSCYVYPLTSSITDFTIGMLADNVNTIRFNLATRQITYGAGISNRNAILEDVPGWPGWLRVGANYEGRVGGWVGALGYSIDTVYTGVSGSKKCYVTGMQYEYKNNVSQFTGGTRSTSGSLIDLSGNNKTVNSISGAYDYKANLFFNGSSSSLDIGNLGTIGNAYSIECVFKSSAIVSYRNVYDMNYATYNPNTGNVGPRLEQVTSNNIMWIWSGNTGSNAVYNFTNTVSISPNTYYHTVFTLSAGTVNTYINGALANSNVASAQGYITSFQDVEVGRGFVLDPARFFSGSIDVFRVYNRALTLTEVYNNYNEYKTRFNLA